MDSSTIIAIINADDLNHVAVTTALLAGREPWHNPQGTLAEVAVVAREGTITLVPEIV